jgi:hypothetical protein
MAAISNEATPAGATANDTQDKDLQETREWMDALSAVIESEGPERAHFLLEQLLEHARQKSIDMPFSANTGYVNTIETDQEERSPGNLVIEQRLRAYMRWNAMAMVVKANRLHPADGGILEAISDRSPRWPASLVPALTISGTQKVKITAATASTFRATCRPASTPAPIWKAA